MKNPPPIIGVVAIGLILIVLVGVIGIMYLVSQYEIDAATLTVLVAPTSGALGALSALLATGGGDGRS